ncbi:hypothetical protein G7047_05395 [Diaphorobacter sp. HDW4A]|uniref:hypothetical protein n=1 Tax=Diaphorobacter sp. HDW4A TaxID=2714924 RepID=UPI00140E050E|nr:hypothetical protein [Diaphorobacter sp. HDW4A]QIL79403.1 hypothetical protein G7047_05395 [Diaphorobacter sp. HDW4A]
METTVHVKQLIAEEILFANGDEVLADLGNVVEKIRILERPRQLIPIIFRWAEENHPYVLDDNPFLHFIEEDIDFIPALEESINRKPTALTIWIVHRLANGETDRSKINHWVAILQRVLRHPRTDEICREDTESFISYHIKRHA